MPDENLIIVEEKIEQTKNEISIKSQDNSASLIAGSILLGALLISAAIFYNTNLLIQHLSSQGAGSLPAGDSAQTGQNQAQNSGPVKVADRSDEPVVGNKNAKITIIEFADFQCPFCQKFFQETYPQIKSKYIDNGLIKMEFRHFPLTQIHKNAQIASVAAECANQQGKFWEYHDLLYKNSKADGTGLNSADLKKYADSLGLNAGTLGFAKNKFNQCLDSNATLKIVQSDLSEGSKDGVTGTPTFFINGKKVVGALPFEQFQTAIESAISMK